MNTIKEFFRTHHLKIAIGAPIIFVLIVSASSTGLIGTGNVFRMGVEGTGQYSATGDILRVSLKVHTRDTFNAVGGLLTFPPQLLQVESVERDTSVIDLWTQDPHYSNAEGTITFSGGVLKPDTKDGTVFVVNFKAIGEGHAFIAMEDGQILSNDGTGENIYTGANIVSVSIRNRKNPTPDVNGDGTLNFDDLTTLYRKTFQSYDARYDLDMNGVVNWGDVKILLAEF